MQCRHLIFALNALTARAYYTTAHPIASQFAGHGCMEYVTTERSFESQATCVFDMLGSFLRYVIRGCLHNQALADVWVTGAGV